MLTVDRFKYCRLADGGGGRGNALHHVKREGNYPEGKCPGDVSTGKCPDSPFYYLALGTES